jgi:predicted kinase
MKTIILVAGLPASGKSETARMIARKTGGIHIECDEIKRSIVTQEIVLNSARQGRTAPRPLLRKMYIEAGKLIVEHARNAEEDVILIDETFHLREFREIIYHVAEELGYRIEIVHVECSDEDTVKSRMSTDNKRKKDHILADQSYNMRRAFMKDFEPIDEKPKYTIDTITRDKSEEDLDFFFAGLNGVNKEHKQ